SQAWFQALRDGRETVLTRADGLFSDTPSMLAAVRSERPLGAFRGAFVAVFPLETLRPDLTGKVAPEGSEVALVDASGRMLTATDESAFPDLATLRRDFRDGLVEMTDRAGDRRVMTAAPFAGEDVYVLLSAPTQGLFSWAMGNALAVFILPILTWLLALFSVLIVTDRIVVRWLAYLERVAAIHARGRHN